MQGHLFCKRITKVKFLIPILTTICQLFTGRTRDILQTDSMHKEDSWHLLDLRFTEIIFYVVSTLDLEVRNQGCHGNFLDLRVSVEMVLPPLTVMMVMFSQMCVCS